MEWRLQALEAENRALRNSRRETEEFLQREIRKLQKDVADRDEKLEKANEQLAWFKKNYWGSRSEKGGAKGEEEQAADEEKSGEETETAGEAPGSKKKRGQQPGSKGPGRSDRSQLREDEQPVDIPGGCNCGTCGKPYRQLLTTKKSPLIEMFTYLLLTNYQLAQYVADCDCEGKKIVTAPPPPKLYKRTTIGNSLWIYLVVQKFLFGAPTSRTLKELSLLGLPLAQGTVTGGFKVIDGLLDRLYEELVDHCRSADLWNGDETTWRVFDSGKKRWWMWLVASDDAVVYLLDPSRSKRVPSEFFAGSVGILMTDRLASYKALHDAITKAWCWVHVRRDILNLFNGVPKLKAWSKDWLEEIARLFVLNHNRFKLWEKNKTLGAEYTQAQEDLAEHVRKLEERWQSELKQPNLHKKQKTVLNSMKKHWPGLTLFLSDPRIPLHNNRAERLLRNSVILRKNSYGSGTEWAGKMAAKLFSIIQTWLINGLDPQALLLDYFNECSKTPGRAPPDVSSFLPWKMSEERKRLFPLPKSYSRPG